MFKSLANRRTFLGGALVTAAMSLALRATTAKQLASRQHIVLLGDSIFDNHAYVPDGTDVVHQLRNRLPPGTLATLAAVDGSRISGVRQQLKLLPADATHLVISAGGNDALHYEGVLDEKVRSVGEALEKLATLREQFVEDYRAMLDEVRSLGLPAAACTIYDARFPDAKRQRVASIGLTIFNETITREVSARGLALIDLRLVCGAEEDLANPIEPSVIGGAKIASVVAAFVREYDWSKGRSEVFADRATNTVT
jgi:hypothetical protein